jgi:hypothetical protein
MAATATDTGATPTATPSAAPTPVLPLLPPRAVIACERTLGRAVGALAVADLTAFHTCALGAFACVQRAPAGPDRDRCVERAARRCERQQRRVERARSVFNDDFIDACAGLTLDGLRAPDVLGFTLLEERCANEIGLALTSPEAIAVCVQLTATCTVERALAAGVPRSGDVLRLLVDADALGLCVPPASGAVGGLGPPDGNAARRCQGLIARGGAKVLKATLTSARGCLDGLFRCRVSGQSAEGCARYAGRCGDRLAALERARGRAVDRMLRACGDLDPDVLLGPLGIDLGAGACAGGATPREVLACVAEAYGCAGVDVLRLGLPILDDEIARAGLTLEAACGE